MLLARHSTSFRAVILIAVVSLMGVAACKHEPFDVAEAPIADNYPSQIKDILVVKCAKSGCHNEASYKVSGGNLLLDSWDHLLDGGNTGAVIVPYSPENSSLLYFTNSHTDLGPLPPDNMRMPLNEAPLSREEYLAVRDWIAKGAPDKNGNIPFADNAETRQKIYLAHQGCDYITVIDAERHVIMRTIPVGREITIESAHSLKVAPDGKFGYLAFWANQYLQKFDTKKDTIAEDIDISFPNSNMLFFSANGEHLLLTNWFTTALMRMDIGSKQMVATYGSGVFTAPHGIATNATSDTFFVTEQYGNMLHKVPLTGTSAKISVDGNPPVASGSGKPGVHNIVMTPSYSKYFVTCEETNEVRVLNAYTDQVLKVINVGKRPQEIVISKTKPYVFVACLEDDNTNNLYKGSVYIINYETYEVVQKITERFNMPHAITVDDRNGMLYVFSRNIDPNGPVPHHNSSTCNGRSGYYSVYDFNTLQPLNNRRYEVTVDPYSADTRFK